MRTMSLPRASSEWPNLTFSLNFRKGTDRLVSSMGGTLMSETNPTTIQSRGQTTKADILQVARQLFSEHGYHKTGIADIQEATGLTKGAFYHHF
ncbi:MAG: helix-turn-helix transcriptional regulator, partial [Sedimentisphaerales bacterium]|nr:helix-turn-helix transcriptional regulator [Sedimentisphaerales bacterium]